jgi:lactoylglutathione lyase
MVKSIITILYVSDQQTSVAFYAKILGKEPVLNVPGMAEFVLLDNCKLGLMPYGGIAKILGEKTPHPVSGHGIPRCELYLYTDDAVIALENALKAGAMLISPLQARDWGDRAGYVLDPDGHVVAVAETK